MRRYLLLAALILFIAPVASATIWHVRSGSACPGGFNGDGTSTTCPTAGVSAGRAWVDFPGIAWGSVAAGDTVKLGCDTFTLTGLNGMSVGASGTVGNPITISPESAAACTIINDNNTASTPFQMNSQSNITIDGLVGNAIAGSNTYGIKMINIGPPDATSNEYCVYNNSSTGGNYIIKHLECSGSSLNGIDDGGSAVWMSGMTEGKKVEVANLWIHGPASGSGGLTTTCFPSLATVNDTKLWCFTATRIFNEAGSSYDLNYIHDNLAQNLWNDGFGCGGNCTVANNEASNIVGSGHSDSIEMQNHGFVAVYGNYIHNSGDTNISYFCDGGDGACSGVRIYNNIINSDPGRGILLDASGNFAPNQIVDDVVIANNTFFGTSSNMIRTVPRGGTGGTYTKIVIKNNIFGKVSVNTPSDRGVSIEGTTTFLDSNAWDYNVYNTASPAFPIIAYDAIDSSRTIALLQAESPARETNGKTGNPSFVNSGAGNYHLLSSDTVAKGAGVNLSATYPYLTTDKDGNQRPSSGAWDMGAYQLLVSVPTGLRGCIVGPGTILGPGAKCR